MMAAAERTRQTGEARMAGAALLAEGTFRDAGAGPVLRLAEQQGRLLLLTLEITRVIDGQSMGLSIWGSADGVEWGSKPLLSLPQKSYCGTYEALLDLPDHPDVQYLRAKWTVSRWAKDDRKPLFTVRLSMREPKRRALSATHWQ